MSVPLHILSDDWELESSPFSGRDKRSALVKNQAKILIFTGTIRSTIPVCSISRSSAYLTIYHMPKKSLSLIHQIKR